MWIEVLAPVLNLHAFQFPMAQILCGGVCVRSLRVRLLLLLKKDQCDLNLDGSVKTIGLFTFDLLPFSSLCVYLLTKPAVLLKKDDHQSSV